MITVDVLGDIHQEEYAAFLAQQQDALLYSSPKYRLLLRRFLGAEDRYLAARRDGRIAAVLPAFRSKSGSFGCVWNSLPFYGSNGGVVGPVSDHDATLALLEEWRQMTEADGVAASTLITSPFDSEPRRYGEALTFTHRDARVGQVSRLVAPDSADIEGALMSGYHQKTRNLVRKAQKSGVEVEERDDAGALEFLVQTHHANIEAIGGRAKPHSFFATVRDVFEYGSDYRIYLASISGERVAALLCFYFNRTVEYFTPAVITEWRSHQPLSLIIHRALKDASLRGYRYWNWGGTWLTQDGVYHFKKRWGSDDLPYYYYTTVRNPELLAADSTTVLSDYPYFYVMPFAQSKTVERAAAGGAEA